MIHSERPLASGQDHEFLIRRDNLRLPTVCWANLPAVRGSGMNPRMGVLWLVLFLAVPLFAREKSDLIIMKNGDRITCEIKGLAADTLYISVDYILGTSSVEWSKVDHVESKQLFIVKTKDGLVHSGTLSTTENSGGRPVEIQILQPYDTKVELDKTQIIKMDQTSETVWQRFNGDIGLGVIYSKGNQSTQYNLSSSLNYPRERWSAGAAYNSTLSSSARTSPATRNEPGCGATAAVEQLVLHGDLRFPAKLATGNSTPEQHRRRHRALPGKRQSRHDLCGWRVGLAAHQLPADDRSLHDPECCIRPDRQRC